MCVTWNVNVTLKIHVKLLNLLHIWPHDSWLALSVAYDLLKPFAKLWMKFTRKNAFPEILK